MFQCPDCYGPRGPGYKPATLSRGLYSIEFPAKRLASLLAVLDVLSHGFYKEILFCQIVRVMSKFLPRFLVRNQGYQRALTVKKRCNGKVINRRPQPGEEQIYDSQDSAAPNYAVMTLWPGKAEQRRILMLSGCNSWATLAAAEYVTQPEHLRNQGIMGLANTTIEPVQP